MKFSNFIKYLLFIFIFSLAISLYWFRNGHIMAAAESGIFFYNLESHFQNTHWAWNSYVVGGATVYTTATAPTYLFFLFLNKIGISEFYLEIFFFFSNLFLSQLGLLLLIRLFFEKIKYKYIFLASLFYLANPLSQVNVWSRFLYNHTIFFSTLPLLVYFFYKGIKLRKYSYTFVFSFFCTIFSYGLSAPAFLVSLWILLGLITFFELLTYKKHKVFLIKYFLLSLIIFLLSNSWWLSQIATGYFGQFAQAQDLDLFTSTGNFDALKSLSRSLGNISDITRFAHATTHNSVLGKIIGYSVFALGFLPLIFYKKRKEILLIFFLMISTIFLMKGINEPFGYIFSFLFNKIIFLQFLRNPFEKISFIYLLIFSIMLAFSASKVLKNKFIYIFFSLIIIIWNHSFFTGDVFSVYENEEKISYEVDVPDDYQIINDSIEDKESRNLVLPFTQEGVIYNWDQKYIGVEPSRDLLSNPSISLYTTIPFYTRYAKQVYNNQTSEKLLSYLPYANIKYLISRKDLDNKSRALPNYKDTDEIINSLEKLSETDLLTLYKNSEDLYWDRIYITNRIIRTNSADLYFVNKFDDSFPKTKNAIAPIDFDYLDSLLLIEPDISFSPFIPGNQDHLSDQELIDSLYFVNHSPEEKIYPLLLLKESLEAPAGEEGIKLKGYEVGLLSKRAIEIYNLKKSSADEKIIAESEKRFEKYLDKVKKYSDFDSENIKSLLYQYSLLERVDSKSADLLSSFIEKLHLKPHFDLPALEQGYTYLVYRYNIPQKDNFNIIFDNEIQTKNIYINGVAVDNLKADVEAGFNEIAIVVDEKLLKETKFTDEKIEINKDENFSKTFDIKLDQKYKIDLNYLFISGNSFDLKVEQDIDSVDKPLFKEEIRKNGVFHGALNNSIDISPSVGANNIKIKTAAVSVEKCPDNFLIARLCKERNNNYQVKINSISLSEVNFPKMYLKSGSILEDKTETVVSYERINPTFYKVYINKKNTNSELLVFSELFDNGWKLENFSHLRVNIFANAWVINREGEYELELKYQPQDVLDKFSYISIFIGLISILIISKKKTL